MYKVAVGIATSFLIIILLSSAYPQRRRLLNMQEAAETHANEFWQSHLTQCGDSYYGLSSLSNSLIQLKGVTIQVDPSTLSEADRLNGYEYRGIVRLKYIASRDFYIAKRAWGDWKSQDGFWNNFIIKRNGEWRIDEDIASSMSKNLSKVSCDIAANPIQLSRQQATAQLTSEMQEAKNLGLYISPSHPIPVNMFRQIYKGLKNQNHSRFYFLDSGWIVSEQRHVIWGLRNNPVSGLSFEGLPESLRSEFDGYTSGGDKYFEFWNAAFSSDGKGVVIYGRDREMRLWAQNLPQDMEDKLNYDNGQGNLGLVQSIVFAPNNGWFISYNDGGYASNNLPEDVSKFIDQLFQKQISFKQLAFGPDGKWLALWQENSMNRVYGFPGAEMSEVFNNPHPPINAVAFSPNGGWVIDAVRLYGEKQ